MAVRSLKMRVTKLAVYVLPWVGLPALFAPGGILINGAVNDPSLMLRVVSHYALMFMPWMLFSPLVQRLQTVASERAWTAGARIGMHVLCWLVLSLCHALLLAEADVMALHLYKGFGRQVGALLPPIFFFIAPMDALIYLAVTGLSAAWLALRRDRERERHLMQSRLYDLQAQLQPHLLFNVLNALAELVHRRPSDAEDAIARLSRLLRRVSEQRDHVHALGDEVKVLLDYVMIQKVLLGDRLAFELDVDAELRECQVPTMILQPLVENAIQHGISRRRGGGKVRVSARRAHADLCLTVANDPAPVGAQGAGGIDRLGIGLSNTRGRLAAMYGPRAGLTTTWGDGAEGETVVTVRLPLDGIAP